MKRILSIISVIIAAVILSGCSNPDAPAKYVFLFIGDGMGTSHVDVTESYLSWKAGKFGGEQLRMTQFPVFGTTTNYSADSYVTDSSAAGTAIACGAKTNNSWLGVDPNEQPLESVATALKEQGYKVGIMSTVPVNHATPASFYGHNRSRHASYAILKEIPESGFEYFAGSGMMGFAGNRWRPEPDITGYLEENGYNVCYGKEELAEAIANKDKVVFSQIYNRGVEPKNYESGKVPEGHTTLAEMVQAGLDLFGDKDPFFMAIEGGEIDWGGHANKTMPMVNAVINFDKAIEVAYQFYLEHPEETLIIVTSDHETGGVALGHTYKVNWQAFEDAWVAEGGDNTLSNEENAALNEQGLIRWTTGDHTGGAVPVYAIGKGAEKFGGRYDNTDIKGKILGK
ncbi:MAG: alkaline phosphatase [Bacteroidales bacterium]|nr:alkaline phosphatase [Bacteroidales bacterium]